MPEFTPDERDLLRDDLGRCIADPAAGIQYLQKGRETGGMHGFTYQYGADAILGQWRERIADAWRDDGKPWRWKDGQIVREARIAYPRLHRWCERLPADIRHRARVCGTVDPKNLPLERIVLAQLAQITLDAINLDDPEPPLFDPEETAHA
ncbi:hypothetical protein NONO_c17650 [Nocardia nova SH22a]|uniref:Uncharacterized protein n=1 Tax=Nocardia nova SH22a TaxID=1415166 RepID=W5TB26_9NOCA|nr:hypothetical protein [Nocardia nova]AHH16565.1 hypothetical protein NONO_c17650 [Nocardia nova SH22a]